MYAGDRCQDSAVLDPHGSSVGQAAAVAGVPTAVAWPTAGDGLVPALAGSLASAVEMFLWD